MLINNAEIETKLIRKLNNQKIMQQIMNQNVIRDFNVIRAINIFKKYYRKPFLDKPPKYQFGAR